MSRLNQALLLARQSLALPIALVTVFGKATLCGAAPNLILIC